VVGSQMISTSYSIFSSTTLDLIKGLEPANKNQFVMMTQREKRFLSPETEAAFKDLVDSIHSAIGKRRSPAHDRDLVFNIEQLLLNFIVAVSSSKYLGVYGNSNQYSEGGALHGFSKNYLSKILKHLQSNYKIDKSTGYYNRVTDEELGLEVDYGGEVNKYLPLPEFKEQLLPFVFQVGNPFKVDSRRLAYVKHTVEDVKTNADTGKQKRTKRTVVRSLNTPQIKQDKQNLKIINKFLESQSYPLKSPITRIYSESLDRGGRLYTPIQQVKNNKVAVRNSLLLNGKPMIELDYKANHLSMCIALYESDNFQSLNFDPYRKLLEAANFNGKQLAKYRNHAKKFITSALGAKSRRGLKSSFSKWFDEEFENKVDFFEAAVVYDRLAAEVVHCFPNTPFYSDEGAKLQKLEGDIMMAVLLEAVEQEILCLPLHDACLTTEDNAPTVEKLMKKYWSEVLDTSLEPVVQKK
jgi:hypothetical protein